MKYYNFILSTIFISLLLSTSSFAYMIGDNNYNEKAVYKIIENGQMERDENYVYFINITGLTGKIQNCTKGIRATNLTGSEIKNLIFDEYFSNASTGYCLALLKLNQKLLKGNNISVIFYYNSSNEIYPNYSLDINTPILLHDDKFLTNGTWTLGKSNITDNRVYGKQGYELIGHNLQTYIESSIEGTGDIGSIISDSIYINSVEQKWGFYTNWGNVTCNKALVNEDGGCYYGQRFWWRGSRNKTYFLTDDNSYHLVSIALNGCMATCGDNKVRIREVSGNQYQSDIDILCQDGVSCWKQFLVKGSFSVFGIADTSYVGGVFFDLSNWNITVIKINEQSKNHSNLLNLSVYISKKLETNVIIDISSSSNTPIINLTQSDFKLFRENQQIIFTNFINYNNGTYSLNISSGNIIGNVSFRIEANGASAEVFAYVSIKPKNSAVIIASDWENIFLAGLTGKPVFTNYSETEKYYFERIKPEQVFVFNNITTNYSTYRFKDLQAFLDTFYENKTAILVSNKEQAIVSAPFAKLKNYPILISPDENNAKLFGNIINLSGKTPDEINDIAIKEFSRGGKNINTIIIANPYSEASALAGALASKHNSIIIPMNFSSIIYPETVSDFYSLNSANGVLRIRQKLNETIKRLSDSFLFSNSIDYKIGRVQLNLILLGNASEVPQPAVFDSGREMFFDYDRDYLLTDFPYSDTNNDGKADIISGRIVSPYQMIELPKTNKIVTAALYRNIETVFSSNGLIESQSTDTAFRTAGFETVRLVENRTNLSYYELTFGLSNVTGFLKKLFSDLSIAESLKLMESIYSGYSEILEHNYYKMMSSLSLGWSGLTIKMFPDERLTKESLLGEMQNADGIFYYGKGSDGWQTESFFGDKISYDDFPANGALVYDERTNSARFPDKTIFAKGISALVGSSGIIYDIYSFMPNAKFAQFVARNRSVALALEESKYPLLPQQIKNLTAAMRFNYKPESDLAIKQFLEMVCYCDPEKKIDPDARDYGSNPSINYSSTFKSRIRIPINYLVSGNSIFFDAEQHLQEMGKPIIPLYAAETILPNGSRIIGITLNYNLSKHENITANFVPIDEHFNDTAGIIRGFYPSQIFYNETFDLLDGRKTVRLIVMGMQYNNYTKEALVLDDAETVIEYSSPFEFIGFSAKNISADQNQTFSINAAGNNLSVVISIRSGNFSETIEQKIPSGYSEIVWKPPFSGDFTATAYVLMGNNSAGPRYAYFTVGNKADFLRIIESLGTDGYNKIMKSFAEKIRLAFDGASAIIEYINPFSEFSLSANSSTIEKKISSPGYSFSVSQDSGKIVYRMKDSRGELILEKNAGATKETCKGDCSELYAKMDSRLSEMQSLQDYVVGNIGK